MAPKKFPKQLYVFRDGSDPDEQVLYAQPQLGGINHGTVVGIYKLVETKTAQVTLTLKPAVSS